MRIPAKYILLSLLFCAWIACGQSGNKRTSAPDVFINDWSTLQVPKEKSYDSEECIKGIDSALAEAKKGNYIYTIHGTVYSDDFEQFYADYMENKYHVHMRATCEFGFFDTQSCFENEANNQILRKYGQNFMERSRADAQRLFKKQKPSQ